MAEEYIERPQPKGPFSGAIFALQASLITLVMGYVLDLHRSVLKLNLYTEQFLLAVLGLAIALCFLMTSRKRILDAAAAAAGLGICLYLAWRYPQLSTELTSRPLMIAETGSSEEGGDKAQWVSSALEREAPGFSRLRAIVWFNSPVSSGGSGPASDFRIDSSPSALRAFRDAIRAPTYGMSRAQLLAIPRSIPGSAVAPPEPEDGYGEVDPKAEVEVERERVPPDVKVGSQLTGRSSNGQTRAVRVKEIKEKTVVLDLNHPLAGKTLLFDVRILSVDGP